MKRSPVRAPLAITRVRLVGFHNFVDETIELSASNGDVRTHLFLVGDNGSGKSTLLDAIHLVLTGADVELNAAARLGPKARGGRTLAGIVLRQRDDRVHAGYAVAYAALELANEAERWTIGIGLGATTLDAHVARWGFVHGGEVSSSDLLTATSREQRPLTLDELTESLGRGSVYGRIGDYRKRVADLFFGGEIGYERACRLWSIAKAHREIVSSTKEPSEIVARFLPAPRSDAIESIRTSVAQLDDLENDARTLEAQRARIAGVVECQAELTMLRAKNGELEEELAWAHRARAESELVALEAQRQQAEAALATAEDRCGVTSEQERRATSMLAAAQTGQVGAWTVAHETARAMCEVRRAELARAVATLGETSRNDDRCQLALANAAQDLERAELRANRALRDAVENACRLGRLLHESTQFVCGAGTMVAARVELTLALESARVVRAEASLHARETERAREVAEWPMSETSPSPSGALQALRDAGIETTTLADAIEPREDADARRLAALETVVTSEVWETLVTDEARLADARIVLAAHPGARLATCSPGAVLPGWVEALLEPEGDAFSARARSVLALELGTGELAVPDALGGLSLRGVYMRSGLGPSRVGQRGRALRRAATLSTHAAILEQTRLAHARAVDVLTNATDDVARLERAVECLAALDSVELTTLRLTHDHADQARRHAHDALASADGAVSVAQATLTEAEQLLVLAERADPALEGELRALGELEAERDRARDARAAALAARAECASRASEIGRRVVELEARIASSRSHGPDQGQGTRTDRSPEDIEREREHVRREERARLDELFGDGSRGVRAPGLIPSFVNVTSDRDTPRFEDATGRAPESVLAELDRRVSEVRSAVNERTRDVFDGVVMGSLAGQLQREIEQLHTTIAGVNELLGRAAYGSVRYAFRVTPRTDRAELVRLVGRMSVLDPASRDELRTYVEERRADLASPGDDPPALLDYRRWFDIRLVTRKQGSAESPWSRERAAAGSGGEQAVPSHLVVFALARLAFDGAGARAAPVMLDEAFHGIDRARREALLEFASELGLQLVVATPDQDGLVRGLRSTTTLFVVKDDDDDVHVVPYHYYDHSSGAQTALAV